MFSYIGRKEICYLHVCMNLKELIFLKIDFIIIYPRQDCIIFLSIFFIIEKN